MVLETPGESLDALVASVRSPTNIDFTEIPSDGMAFQDFVAHYFRVFGTELGVERYEPGGKGADGGVDGRAYIWGNRHFFPQPEKWVVQCKHLAHSKRSASVGDLEDGVVDLLATEGAAGYLLITSTALSDKLVTRLRKLSERGTIRTHYWDGARLATQVAARGKDFGTFFPAYATWLAAVEKTVESVTNKLTDPRQLVELLKLVPTRMKSR